MQFWFSSSNDGSSEGIMILLGINWMNSLIGIRQSAGIQTVSLVVRHMRMSLSDTF